jgi:hypothetical protein
MGGADQGERHYGGINAVQFAGFGRGFARKNPQSRLREVTPPVPYGTGAELIQQRRDAMLILRFITAGAVLVMAVGAAAAQSAAAGDTAGKPVSLSQVAGQPETTAAKPHSRFAHRRAARRLAKKSHDHATEAAAEDADQPEQSAATSSAPAAAAPTAAVSASAAGAWATNATPLPGVATDATAPTVVPAIDQNLSALVGGGRTVQISEPDQFNAIDLAADHQATTTLSNATDIQTAAPVAVAQPDDHSRDAWYEEIIAVLGGAAAAGTVAWFLIIGAAPQRMFG